MGGGFWVLEGGVVELLSCEVCEQHVPLKRRWKSLDHASLITQLWLILNPFPPSFKNSFPPI